MSFDPKQLSNFPQDAGVYLMKNAGGSVIYVGKALHLKVRLKQYFGASSDTRPMIPFLLAELASIETIVVSTEKEALILENTLIKKYKPKFNILLKDDKTYIALTLNLKEKWPRLRLMRFKDSPGSNTLYFGPYTSTLAAKQTFELMSRLFPLRQCSNAELQNRTRPCLLYSMKKCIAPCMGYCTEKEYNTYVKSAIDFLEGNSETMIEKLKAEMHKASDQLEFEKAAAFLRTIEQVKHVTQDKTVFQKSKGKSIDAIGLYREGDNLLISALEFRHRSLVGTASFSFSQSMQSDEEILSSFILQLYSLKKEGSLPDEILVPCSLQNSRQLTAALKELHPKSKLCTIKAPQKGSFKDLLALAQKNAKASFAQKAQKQRSKEALLLQLQEALKLTRLPSRIECFDTSNLSGSHLVASSVVFIDGEEDKKKVKLYHIKGIDKPDDYAALRQALTRRILRAKEEEVFPDLLIIDGGKGQLGVAKEVLKEHGLVHINVISLVKDKGRHDKGLSLEKAYIPQDKEPIAFPKHSPLLFFLQKIRDAAHEKAIGFYRKTHSKSQLQSQLDTIPGIGPVKKKRLLQAFGSMKNITNQSEEKLAEIPGITAKDIAQIKSHIKK